MTRITMKGADRGRHRMVIGARSSSPPETRRVSTRRTPEEYQYLMKRRDQSDLAKC